MTSSSGRAAGVGLAMAAVAVCGFAGDAAAAAAAGSGNLPFEGWLTDLQKSMTGPVAFSLALIGILVAGGTLLFAGDSLEGFAKKAVQLVLVMGFVIGGQGLMSNFFGQGAMMAPPAVAEVVAPAVLSDGVRQAQEATARWP